MVLAFVGCANVVGAFEGVAFEGVAFAGVVFEGVMFEGVLFEGVAPWPRIATSKA